MFANTYVGRPVCISVMAPQYVGPFFRPYVLLVCLSMSDVMSVYVFLSVILIILAIIFRMLGEAAAADEHDFEIYLDQVDAV